MKGNVKLFIMSVLIGACLTTGCNGLRGLTADEKKEQSIGVVMGSFEDTWRTLVRNELYEMAEGKIEISIWDATNSQETENEKVDTLINKNVNVLVVNLVEQSGATSIIEKAKKADIPVVFFNIEPSADDLKLWDKVYYVGSKAQQSGTMQGQILASYFKSNPTSDGTIHYVMLKGPEEHPDAKLRTQYVIESLQEAGFKIEESAADVAMWKREEAEEKMESFLAKEGVRMDCVIANNDDMALGAIDALKSKGYFIQNKYIPVVGVDATTIAIGAIDEGSLLGTVLNDAASQGKAIFNLASVLIEGQVPSKGNVGNEIIDSKYIWIDYKMVTKENTKDIN